MNENFSLETNVEGVTVKTTFSSEDHSEPYDKIIYVGSEGVQTSLSFRFYRDVTDFTNGRSCSVRKYIWAGETLRLIDLGRKVGFEEGKQKGFSSGFFWGWAITFGLYALTRLLP